MHMHIARMKLTFLPRGLVAYLRSCINVMKHGLLAVKYLRNFARQAIPRMGPFRGSLSVLFTIERHREKESRQK